MPLTGHAATDRKELWASFKRKKKIGNTKPKSKAHAGKIINAKNARWGSKFGQRTRWAAEWRDATDNALLHWWATHPEAQREARGWVWQPIAVVLTAHLPRQIDDDAIPPSVYPVRDRIAAAFGIHDGPGSGCTWDYFQVATRERSGVVVQISRVVSGMAPSVAVEEE